MQLIKQLIYLTILLVCLALLFMPNSGGESAPSHETNYNKVVIVDMIGYYSEKYEVSRETMNRIVSGESSYNVKTKDGDMEITCPSGVNKGKPVRARGLVQITECYFPEVTDEQAYNPHFALDFLASKLSAGKGRLWSTY